MITRPSVKDRSVVIRTLLLLIDTVGVVSTRMTALPAELIWASPAFCASVCERYCTLPCVGSAVFQKDQPLKNVAPLYVAMGCHGDGGADGVADGEWVPVGLALPLTEDEGWAQLELLLDEVLLVEEEGETQ